MSRCLFVVALGICVCACARVSAEAAGAAKNRTWLDVTGKHRTVAKFLELKDGRVRLKKTDGKTISLPLEQLSEADRQYVQDLTTAQTEPAVEKSTPAAKQQGAEPTPEEKENISQGPPKKGKSWSNVNDVEVNGEKRRAGKRFTIWPTTDEPVKIEGGKLTLRLRWQVAADQAPPGEPKQDAINLSLFIVSKTARLLRGQAVKLDVGAKEGETERTESLDGDLRGADVYAYFSHDSIDAGKPKLVSTPLSNIIRIKVSGKQ
ncbi:MAG TPA: SHD1 domain-containing protein [Pirellulales bacterium]|nr:SHD1 domain-containing protein [Pirellulales bacterium]